MATGLFIELSRLHLMQLHTEFKVEAVVFPRVNINQPDSENRALFHILQRLKLIVSLVSNKTATNFALGLLTIHLEKLIAEIVK